MKLFYYCFVVVFVAPIVSYSKEFYETNVAEHIVNEFFDRDKIFAIVRRPEHSDSPHSPFRLDNGKRIYGDIRPGEQVAEFTRKYSLQAFTVEFDFCGDLDRCVFIGKSPWAAVFTDRPTHIAMAGAGSRWFVIGEDVVGPEGKVKSKFVERYSGIADLIPLAAGMLVDVEDPEGLNIYSIVFKGGVNWSHMIKLNDLELSDLISILSAACSLRNNSENSFSVEDRIELLDILIEMEDRVSTSFGNDLVERFIARLENETLNEVSSESGLR